VARTAGVTVRFCTAVAEVVVDAEAAVEDVVDVGAVVVVLEGGSVVEALEEAVPEEHAANSPVMATTAATAAVSRPLRPPKVCMVLFYQHQGRGRRTAGRDGAGGSFRIRAATSRLPVTYVPHLALGSMIANGGRLMSRPRGFRKVAVATVVSAVAVLGAACSSSSSSPTTTAAPSTTATSVALPTTVIPTQTADPTVSASVPSAVKSTGTLTIALDATYAPDEFIAPDGSTIVGMDADLATAISQVLGLKPTLVNATFDTIIPGIQSGKYGMGASSFTDTIAREKVVDFVDYFTAGEGFYVKTGSSLAFNGLTSLCGHSVAVESGTTEQADAQTQAKACTKDGKGAVTVLAYGNQSEANLAVSSGRADVGFADSQVAGYIVATSNGVFQNSGTAFEVAPYGLALPKGNGMAAPVQAAVNLLIKNGVYGQILTKWGIQAGAVTSSVINGATS